MEEQLTAEASPETSVELVTRTYRLMVERIDRARNVFRRPLTFAEKVLLGHLVEPVSSPPIAGQCYVELAPDRVAMQDATAQMALLQVLSAGIKSVATPSTVHCDHLIEARSGATLDLANAGRTNAEVYEFLESVSARLGIGFWPAGSGIIHQVFLEQYAFPGGLAIGTDSHTPNAGGLANLAIGVGGADAVDVMVGLPFELGWPKLIGVKLIGEASGWTAPKDVILEVASQLTVKGGTNAILEYFGPGASTISATGKATIANMGAEVGATGTLFAYDDHGAAYLKSTGREAIADLARTHGDLLRADPEVEAEPHRFFDRVIEIDLASLEPRVVGPHSPDRARPVSSWAAEVKTEGWPTQLARCLIGSCTNSSYEDISRAAHVARQAAAQGLRARVPLLITPGSERVRATVERDGYLADLEAIGATVLANACGPCIGQWSRDDVQPGQVNVILSSYNRNFPKRNDGNPSTLSFIASPEVVVAYALSGDLRSNPLVDLVQGIHLTEPAGLELPPAGFATGDSLFIAPPPDGSEIEVKIAPGSSRLQLLEPFPASPEPELIGLPVALKAAGKCTTDHISPAGPWLRFRGHLENISGNLFSGVVNAFSGQPGAGRCPIHQVMEPFPEVMSHLRQAGILSVVVGDENYGEGSSREHAAMEPRFTGVRAVICRSFARIHEANLKKQGVLALTFADPSLYDQVLETDRVSLLGLNELEPGRPVEAVLQHEDGTRLVFSCLHTMSADHIRWYRAGSALNIIKNQAKA
jgi:aconitate hydratase